MTIVNWQIISNPLNWVIVFLMIAIAFIGAGYVIESASF